MEFKDVIHHTTTTKFPFWQRVRHLLGAPVVIKSTIKCEHEPGYIETEAKGMHTRIFPKKDKGGLMQSGPSGCPKCGAKEIEADSPRTVYACGSSDYDQRPGSFVQSEKCKGL